MKYLWKVQIGLINNRVYHVAASNMPTAVDAAIQAAAEDQHGRYTAEDITGIQKISDNEIFIGK
jgi:hypothetical protein